MKILLIDTCGAPGSIAVALAGPDASPAILATETLRGRTASERLVPAINTLIAAHATTLQSLTAIAIVHGPGSFTGIRVGLSAAKGLCEALNLPLIAISRLAVLVEMASPQSPTGRIHALLDAGRGEFYYGEYAGPTCLRETLLTRDEVVASLTNGETVIVCELTVAASLAPLAPHLIPEPTAADALPLALRRIHEASFDDIAAIDANYVRRTDAQIFAKPNPKPLVR